MSAFSPSSSSFSKPRSLWLALIFCTVVILTLFHLDASPRTPLEAPRIDTYNIPLNEPPSPQAHHDPSTIPYDDIDHAALPIQPQKPAFDCANCYNTGTFSDECKAWASSGIISCIPDPKLEALAQDRPLILYAYAESDYGYVNLKFFIDHGLHSGADFVFILNGESNATKIIPSRGTNVRYVKRNNTCFDLGAHAEVLTKKDVFKKGDKALKDQYKRFILMNASVRGPFVPHWSRDCWSESYLGRINEKVKLVGSSLNCDNKQAHHVQSMIWATDSTGLSILLDKSSPSSINQCFPTIIDAMQAEIGATALIRENGYDIDVMMQAFQSEKDYKFPDVCAHNSDYLWEGQYFGFDIHPYETMFFKSARGIMQVQLDRLTEWTDASGYSSEVVCGVGSGNSEV